MLHEFGCAMHGVGGWVGMGGGVWGSSLASDYTADLFFSELNVLV